MLTIHILTKNDESTIGSCLDSISSLDCHIIIADLGSTDNTLRKCKRSNAAIISIPLDNDYSRVRNAVVASTATEWQMMLHPWETLDSGHEQIAWAVTQDDPCFKVYKVADDVITRERRIWKKGQMKFERPIYESLEPALPAITINAVISGSKPIPDASAILSMWRDSAPHAEDMEYYLAMNSLVEGKIDDFMSHARKFLFLAKENANSILIRYYYAMINLLAKKNPEECIRNVIQCLMKQPTMAEFWCLLGDAFYKMKQWHRAIAFYENAIAFGSRRVNDDDYPIEIKKYGEYPESMIMTCKELIQKISSTTTVT